MAIFDYVGNYEQALRGQNLDIEEKEKRALILKRLEEQKQEQERQRELRTLSEALQNVSSLPRQPLYNPEIPVEQDPAKRQQILKQQDQDVMAKQDAGGTFTNEDLVPYMQAGIRSYGSPPNAGMEQAGALVEAGVPLRDSIALTASPKAEKRGTQVVEIPRGGQKHKVLLDTGSGDVLVDYGAMPEIEKLTKGETVVRDAALEAQKQLEQGLDIPAEKDIEKIVRDGTGPWAAAAAFFDSTIGGLAPGQWKIAPDTQAARQSLRMIRQVGKSAFMNSIRGPVWEQQMIQKLYPDPDTYMTNPESELSKVSVLREHLLSTRKENLTALASGSLTGSEVAKLRMSNQEINTLLAVIGTSTKGKEWVENGVRYRINPQTGKKQIWSD